MEERRFKRNEREVCLDGSADARLLWPLSGRSVVTRMSMMSPSALGDLGRSRLKRPQLDAVAGERPAEQGTDTEFFFNQPSGYVCAAAWSLSMGVLALITSAWRPLSNSPLSASFTRRWRAIAR